MHAKSIIFVGNDNLRDTRCGRTVIGPLTSKLVTGISGSVKGTEQRKKKDQQIGAFVATAQLWGSSSGRDESTGAGEAGLPPEFFPGPHIGDDSGREGIPELMR